MSSTILDLFTSPVYFFYTWKVPGRSRSSTYSNETHVIEKESLKSFLSGKSYKKCKVSH